MDINEQTKKTFRLTEDDIAFQLQFMEEQEHQELMDGDSEDYNDKFDDHENAGEEENSVSKKQDKGRDVELSSEERVLMFKVNHLIINFSFLSIENNAVSVFRAYLKIWKFHHLLFGRKNFRE